MSFRLVPVYSGTILVHFVSFRCHSTSFRHIPVYSGIFRFFCVSFRLIPVSFRLVPVCSGTILVHSVSFQCHSASFRHIPVYSGIFRSVPVFSNARSKLGLLTLKNRRHFMRFLQLVYKIINDYNCPNQLKGYLPRRSSLHWRDLRDNSTLYLPKANTAVGQKTFQYAAAKDWNDLPKSIRSITTFSSFKAALYSFLQKSDKLPVSHRCTVN